MARSKKTTPVGPPAGWVINTSYQLSPQIILEVGDQCRIKGEQGTFTFKRHVINTNLKHKPEWIDVYGGASGHGQMRSITPDRVTHIPKKRSTKKADPAR